MPQFSLAALLRVTTITALVCMWFSFNYASAPPFLFTILQLFFGIAVWGTAVFMSRNVLSRSKRIALFFGLFGGWVLLALYGELLLYSFGSHSIDYSEAFAGVDVIAAQLLACTLSIPAAGLAWLEYRAWNALMRHAISPT